MHRVATGVSASPVRGGRCTEGTTQPDTRAVDGSGYTVQAGRVPWPQNMLRTTLANTLVQVQWEAWVLLSADAHLNLRFAEVVLVTAQFKEAVACDMHAPSLAREPYFGTPQLP